MAHNIDIVYIDKTGVKRNGVVANGIEFSVEGGKISCIQYDDGKIYIEYMREQLGSKLVIEPLSRWEFKVEVIEE